VHLAEVTIRHGKYLDAIGDLERMGIWASGCSMMPRPLLGQRSRRARRGRPRQRDRRDHDTLVKTLLGAMRQPGEHRPGARCRCCPAFSSGWATTSGLQWVVYGIEGQHVKLK
jgi:hypothetical protein